MSESRIITMAPHLWELLARMSAEMGVSVDALASQAIFILGRQNGYVLPSQESKPTIIMQNTTQHASKGAAVSGPIALKEPVTPKPPADTPYDIPAGAVLHHAKDAAAVELKPARRQTVLMLCVEGHEPFRMLRDSLTIGRGKNCDYAIDSNRVSREHARISREGSAFFLEDLKSSNGTFYGGALTGVTRQQIKDGDEFILGNQKIAFRIHEGTLPPA